MSLHIRIERSNLSLQPLRDPKKPPAWDNSDANNSLDLFILYDDDAVLFSCRAQTVANLEGLDPGVHYHDTIAPGPFQLRAFVDRRAFWPRIHGICNCRTLAGQTINEDSIAEATESLGVAGMEGQTHQPRNDARTLMHDWEFPQGAKDRVTGLPIPQGHDTRFAQSAACVVVKDDDLAEFNAILDARGVKKDDYIPGVLEMAA